MNQFLIILFLILGVGFSIRLKKIPTSKLRSRVTHIVLGIIFIFLGTVGLCSIISPMGTGAVSSQPVLQNNLVNVKDSLPADIALIENKQIDLIVSAEYAVKAHLKDPDSAEFDKVFYHFTQGQHHVICGQVNAKNGLGGYMGYQAFISNGEHGITLLQSDVKPKTFKDSWKRLCVSD